MAFKKKTVKDIDLKGKTVLVRADYNVPIEDGRITSEYRIEQSLDTINYLLSKDCRVILCSHLGRPDGQRDLKYSLRPVARALEKHLKKEVNFTDDCIGDAVKQAVEKLPKGGVMLMENLRFHAEEEANDDNFAKQLAAPAEIFVQDGFGVVHRAHASTDAINKYLPGVAGLLLAKEVDTITGVMENPKRPLMAIVGGAKIADKLDVINRFIEIADIVTIGGAMANTFLLAEGVEVGESIVDKDYVPLAKDILKKVKEKSKKQNFIFYIPQDGVVATGTDKTANTRIVDWTAHTVAQIENYPKLPPRRSGHVLANEKILDIGPFSASFIVGSMQMVETVIWNGTMGVTETESLNGPVGPFAHGTEIIIDGLLGEFGRRPFSVIGGGDTAGYIEERKLTPFFNHVSTGGGASMELMIGKKLPGVEALKNK